MHWIFKRTVVKLWTWHFCTWMCVLTQCIVFFLCLLYSGLCVYKKHNLPLLAKIKAPSLSSPFLFLAVTTSLAMSLGRGGKDVFALWSPCLKGMSVLTESYLHCNWFAGCLVQLFQLKPKTVAMEMVWLEIGISKVLFSLDVRECCNSTRSVSVEQKIHRWATASQPL